MKSFINIGNTCERRLFNSSTRLPCTSRYFNSLVNTRSPSSMFLHPFKCFNYRYYTTYSNKLQNLSLEQKGNQLIEPWLKTLGLPEEEAKDLTSKLAKQAYRTKQDLEKALPSNEQLERLGIPLRWTIIILKALSPIAQGIPMEDFTLGAPHPLLQTPGCLWIYQESSDLSKSLQLSTHYDNWHKKNTDKGAHPLFLALSGAGTGKSRLLQEFPVLSIKANSENMELTNRLKDAYVFNITFENGTGYYSEYDKSAEQAIANRMLWQMYSKKSEVVYTKFVSQLSDNYRTPFDVLQLLGQLLHKKLKEMTVFILLDGLQKLPHVHGKRDTLFYNTLSTVASLINQCPVFVIGCCSATVSVPVSEVLASSPQCRVFLTVPPLNGKVIFHQYLLKPNPILELLIDDMGGHGRALELLELQWLKYIQAPESYDISDLMSGLRQLLLERYPDYEPGQTKVAGLMGPILRAVMTKYKFNSREDKIPGTNWTIDNVCSYGLIHYNVDPNFPQTLSCAFIWIWLLATRDDENLYQLVTGQYEKIAAISHGYKANFPNWTQFELFNAHFRCLKSTIYNGQTITMSKLHDGAFLKDGNFNVTIKPMKVAEATKQYQTKTSAKTDIIECCDGEYRVSDGNHFFTGIGNSPSADGWCQLSKEPPIRETHQYKFVHGKAITLGSFNIERQKAADEDDFFIMFTIFENNKKVKDLSEKDEKKKDLSEKDLPSRSGLVTKSNYKAYYGPFAGRVFFMTTSSSIFSINTATREQLQMVPGIGPARVNLILQKRPFDNLDDCVEKTGLQHKVMAHFFFAKK